MAGAALKPLTYEDYLELERSSQRRHEWHAGEVVAMAGGSLTHAALGTRLTVLVGMELRGKPCQPWNSDTKVRVPSLDVTTYPDLTIVCGQPERDPKDRNALVNPSVIFEVLSPSTETYDSREKFGYYTHIPGLHEYVLVCQNLVGVDHYERRKDGTWLLRRLGPGDTLRLKCVRVKVSVDELFAGVTLEPRRLQVLG